MRSVLPLVSEIEGPVQFEVFRRKGEEGSVYLVDFGTGIGILALVLKLLVLVVLREDRNG